MTERYEAGALKITRDLGIPEEEVKRILKKLLRTYDNDWTFIADDNYRTLVEAYFECSEDKKKLDSKKGRRVESCGVSSSRLPKRLYLGGKDERNSSQIIDLSGDSISQDNGNPPQTTTIPRRQNENPSRPRLVVPQARTNIKIESSASLGLSSRGIKLEPLREKPTVSHKKSLSEPGSSAHIRENRPEKLKDDGFPKPSSLKPIPASRPDLNSQSSSSTCYRNPQPLVNQKRPFNYVDDITKGTEKVKISLVDDFGNESLPKFNYIPENIIYQHAKINISMARIADEACCSGCSGDCLRTIPCACASETGGEFAYTKDGLLKEEFLKVCLTMKEKPQDHDYFKCGEDCPLENLKSDLSSRKCKGHLMRKFIKECWRKCGCDMRCGNRVVQRGISCKLQVFLTSEGKGWGLRSLEALPKGKFICEYVGEVLTNSEMYDRNMRISKERHTYPVTLDADWGAERILEDDDALCLDGTFNGNVARFINHRCSDGNLVDIPVEVETPDHHYYHVAFFTTRDVAAYEELTWDYGIDFEDMNHPIEAFRCSCGSAKCRGIGYSVINQKQIENS